MKYEVLAEIIALRLKSLSEKVIKAVKYNWLFKLITIEEQKCTWYIHWRISNYIKEKLHLL